MQSISTPIPTPIPLWWEETKGELHTSKTWLKVKQEDKGMVQTSETTASSSCFNVTCLIVTTNHTVKKWAWSSQCGVILFHCRFNHFLMILFIANIRQQFVSRRQYFSVSLVWSVSLSCICQQSGKLRKEDANESWKQINIMRNVAKTPQNHFIFNKKNLKNCGMIDKSFFLHSVFGKRLNGGKSK